ncbi:thiol peroxidase [Clostridium sp. CCUG 7971]|uniref:thiol peroxidase n=1 Tax=Clostridium sp. CCUG 7971 TaxID=2811414 RepID=UPI001ABB0E8C|nr:thiol peroxidase [Clostridium sp. CCUG 7971]MBO3444144.1 thiol peroxidase [Clostridium sp. CCUG 7971]
MQVKFQGAPLTLEGNIVKVGDKAPDFIAVDNDLKDFKFSDTKGKIVILSVPSLDTPVCDMEIRRFNEEASKLDGVKVYAISMDLPFAQSRWCAGANIKNVQSISDYKDRDFGKNYGAYVKELGLLARAVFIVDENNDVIYADYLEEMTSEPDYDKVLSMLK